MRCPAAAGCNTPTRLGHARLALQVQQLFEPSAADIQQAIMEFAPNILYLYAGCTGEPDAAASPLHPLLLRDNEPLQVATLPQLASSMGLHALIMNAVVEFMPTQELQQFVPHVIHWKAGAPLCCLYRKSIFAAAQIGHSLLARA